MKLQTFRIGGVHPDAHKLTAEVATKVAELPKKAIFPLSQHIGAPAQAVVKKGDIVTAGPVIAKPADKALSVAIHASISGRVADVNDQTIVIVA